MTVQTWTSVIVDSLQELWIAVVAFLPNLIGALIIFVIGLIVAAGLGRLVEKIFDAVRLDRFLAKIGLAPHFERAGMHLRGARFLGRLVYWFLVVAFLLAAANALQLTVFAGFLREVLFYLGNVVVAVLIMLAALVVANFARHLVVGSVMSARLHGEHFLGVLTWWAITLFGFFAALSQLGVAETVVNALVVGVIAMLALAGGLAFGLGGRDYAASLLAKLREGGRK